MNESAFACLITRIVLAASKGVSLPLRLNMWIILVANFIILMKYSLVFPLLDVSQTNSQSDIYYSLALTVALIRLDVKRLTLTKSMGVQSIVHGDKCKF